MKLFANPINRIQFNYWNIVLRVFEQYWMTTVYVYVPWPNSILTTSYFEQMGDKSNDDDNSEDGTGICGYRFRKESCHQILVWDQQLLSLCKRHSIIKIANMSIKLNNQRPYLNWNDFKENVEQTKLNPFSFIKIYDLDRTVSTNLFTLSTHTFNFVLITNCWYARDWWRWM